MNLLKSENIGICDLLIENKYKTELKLTNYYLSFSIILQGGFKIQLLDELERPILDLTPSVGDKDFVRTDTT